MHGSENVKYAFVGFFTKSNKQWSSSMYVFPHKMEKTNVLYPPKKLDSFPHYLSIISTYILLLTYFRGMLIFSITKQFTGVFTEVPTDNSRLETKNNWNFLNDFGFSELR